MARENLQTGDIAYFREGLYSEEDDWGCVIDFCGNNHSNGNENQGMAMIAYPGEKAQLGDSSRGNVIRHHGSSGDVLSYWTFSKFVMRASQCITNWGINYPGRSDHNRFVGNDMSTTAHDATPGGTIVAFSGQDGGQSYLKFYGNLVADGGVDTRGDVSLSKAYGIYFNGYGWHDYIDLGWNEICHNSQGRGIQLYGHRSTDWMDNVSIHDNYIHHNDMTGVVLGGGDGNPQYEFLRNVEFFNNIVADNGYGVNSEYESYGGIHIGGGFMSNGRYGGIFHISNNVIYNNEGSNIAFNGNAENPQITGAHLTNNIIYSITRHISANAYEIEGVIEGKNNLYFGTDDKIPGWDTFSLNIDPRFIDASNHNFMLLSDSPCVDAGSSHVADDVNHGYDGIPRPQGEAFDIGSFEIP